MGLTDIILNNQREDDTWHLVLGILITAHRWVKCDLEIVLVLGS
jgi:hypothetical protein